jgi:mRNA interferase MazF
VRRGEVWTVNFDPVIGHEQAGRRPALIVTANAFNATAAGLVAVLPITSKPRPLPSRVRVTPPEGGLSMESWIITEQLRTVSKQRLISRLGSVTPSTMEAVETSLRFLLDLDA